jgi:TolB protein
MHFRILAVACLVCGIIGAEFVLAQEAPSREPPIERLTKTYFPKFFLACSPDGSHIVYSRHHENRRAANKILVGARIVRADGTNDRPLLPEFDAQVQIQEHPAWSPDGKTLLVSGGGNDTGNSLKDIFRCDVDREFRATNLRKLVAGEGVQFGEEPAWSPDGKQIAYVTITEQLWVASADGTKKVQLVQVAGQYCHQPAWSPDGEWIAFSSDRDGNVELYKIRSDGTELTRLTTVPGIDCRPRWSPDAAWILFSSNRDGNFNLYLMKADGTAVRALTNHPALDDHGAWMPDGRSIVFVSFRDGGFDIYRMTVPTELQIAAAPPVVNTRTAAADSAADPGNPLVAHYDFEGAGTMESRDRAGRNHLLLSGARVVREGERGALEFDGRTAFATAGNGLRLHLAGPLTISLWVRPEGVNGNGYLVSKHGWNIYLGSDLIPRFETRTAADNAWHTLPAKAPLRRDEWAFVVAVFDRDAKKLRVYVDGQLSAEQERTDGAIGSVAGHSLELGHYVASRTQQFQGRLDEVRLYNKALSAEDIAREYATQRKLVTGR